MNSEEIIERNLLQIKDECFSSKHLCEASLVNVHIPERPIKANFVVALVDKPLMNLSILFELFVSGFCPRMHLITKSTKNG
mmetsp:Transcript_22607/g.34547  ORF Transcript_22607/g.34547 Transcript_22607/m.34547 type:complete len:81 (-) Transcript_22607:788-1030(-)